MDRRLEREIQEILNNSTNQSSGLSPEEFKPIMEPHGKLSILGRIRKKIFFKQLFLTGVGLMFSALILGIISPGIKSGVLFWSGLTLFIVTYAFYFTRPSLNSQLRWRGKLVKYDGDSSKRKRN